MYVGDISFYFTANSDRLIFISCANNTVGNSLWFWGMGEMEMKPWWFISKTACVQHFELLPYKKFYLKISELSKLFFLKIEWLSVLTDNKTTTRLFSLYLK